MSVSKADSAQGNAPAVIIPASAAATQDRQYTLAHIAGVWALASLPTALLAWVVAPALIRLVNQPPALIFWLLLILGMLSQTALGLWLVYREEGNLRWSTIRRATWLKVPTHPKTGLPRARLLWRALGGWFIGLFSLGLGVLLANRMVLAMVFERLLKLSWYPASPAPAYAQVTELASPEFAGRWEMIVLAVVSWALSAFFAEEFIFRGVLLPRMAGAFGKWDWVANAGLYGLYHLHKPWMIPFRFLYGLSIARPAKRYHSNWMAVCVHGVEAAALLALVLVGVTSSPLPPLPASLSFPSVSARPSPAAWYQGTLSSLPQYDPNSDFQWQVDLRGRDLSALDLRNSTVALLYADFDSHTIWPLADHMPTDLDPRPILEMGKNPGLGVRRLHAEGITGRGVGIAIIDQRLLTEHQEYAERLRWYEEVGSGSMEPAAMHGAAVSSIAVGKTVGVAPEADLYYIGVSVDLGTVFMQYHGYAQAVRRILGINRTLPAAHKIRVISMSTGWLPEMPGYYDLTAAVQEAKAEGMLVVSSNLSQVHGFSFRGLGRSPMADPDLFQSYEPGLYWANSFYGHEGVLPDTLLIPMDSRTTASPTGPEEYVFYREGGLSWAIPYVAGMYALAAQADPSITPERFWSLALQTGQTITVEHEGQGKTLEKILDPIALVQALKGR